jgi:restriction endonuclease S subunit
MQKIVASVSIGIPSIMPQNIGDNRVFTEGIARITPEDAARLSRYLVQTGDIVYSRRGDVERRAFIRAEEDGWLCGTGCLRVRFGNSEVDPLYASYYLGHPSVRGWIVRHAVGATMPNLNTSILSALPFVISPLTEQKAIAQILSSLDDKIELNREMNKTLEAIAQATFKSWFVDFDPFCGKMEGRQPVGMDAASAELFPNEFEESALGMILKGWKVIKFGNLIDIKQLQKYLELQKNLELNPPILIMLSLLRVKGYTMGIDRSWLDQENPIDRDILIVLEIVVEDYAAKSSDILRPAFDAVWQACGWDCCQNYDASGNWIGNRR